jgi:hypothetical protein
MTQDEKDVYSAAVQIYIALLRPEHTPVERVMLRFRAVDEAVSIGHHVRATEISFSEGFWSKDSRDSAVVNSYEEIRNMESVGSMYNLTRKTISHILKKRAPDLLRSYKRKDKNASIS